MPKAVKFILILAMTIVTCGLLVFLIHGQIAPKSRAIMKLSGFTDWKELGKYTYRQTYGQLSQVQYLAVGGGDETLWEDFLLGFQKESLRISGFEWTVLKQIPIEFNDDSKYIIRLDFDQSFPFSPAYIGNQAMGRFFTLSISSLIPPKDMESLSNFCGTDKNISLQCLKERISLVAKMSWGKVVSCKKGTLDQVAKFDYLLLISQEECIDGF